MDLMAQNITHAYGGMVILQDVSLHVESGQIMAVLGPSGCGKSTLLRILGGLEKPDSGAVFTNGAAEGGTLNPLTYVFQDFALVPWLNVYNNIDLVLRHHGLSRADRDARIEGVLTRVNLREFAKALPKQLSGGMRQRAAIARALAVNPAILLMDEPLSALDAQTRALLMEDLKALWQQSGFSAVYVTHNLSEAVQLGHKIAVLSRRPGRLRELISVDMPLADRSDDAPELLAIRDHIWHLIRDEAAMADREMVQNG